MTPEQDNDCFGHCNGGKKACESHPPLNYETFGNKVLKVRNFE